VTELARIGLKWMAVIVLMTSFLVTAFWAGSRWHSPLATPIPRLLTSTGPPVIQLERIGELAPVRIHVADVLIAEGEGHRGAWLIKGDALISCDISRAKLSHVDNVNRTARLQLPPLKVTSARVDFEKTKTWSVEKTTWLPWSAGDQGLFRDAAMFHAQQLVKDAASSGDSLDAARSQTERIIHQIYLAVEWKIDTEWTE
jgi:hypothetical protein